MKQFNSRLKIGLICLSIISSLIAVPYLGLMTGWQWFSSENVQDIPSKNSKDVYGRARSAFLEAPILFYPSDGFFLNTPNVELEWEPVVGAIDYIVQVFSGNDPFYTEQIPSTSIVTPDLTEGSYSWQVQALDEFNEWGDWSEMWSFHVDLTPPQSTATVEGIEGINGWFLSSVLITLTADDSFSGMNQIQYSYDRISWESYVAPIEVNQEGVQSVFYYATDNAMNQEYDQAVEVALDLSPPTTTVQVIGDVGMDYWYTSTVTVILTTEDSGSGVQNIFFSLDEIIWQLYTDPVVLDDGNYKFSYYSTDNAGRMEEIRNFPLWVDRDPPYTEAEYVGSLGLNGYYTTPVQVSLNAESGLATILTTFVSLDGMNWVEYISPFIINTEGDNHFYAYSVDVAGNVEKVKTFMVQIDYSIPISTIFLDGIGGMEGWYISPVDFAFQAEDLISGVDKILYQIDDNDWIVYSAPFQLNLEGYHIIRVYAIDWAGNIGITQFVEVNIDYTPPITTLHLDGTLYNNQIFISAVTAEFYVLDSVAGVDATYYSWDNVIYLPYISPISIVESGVYSLFYFSRDAAGNQEGVKFHEFLIDSHSPHSNAVVDGNLGMNGWYISSVDVTLTAMDPDSVVVNLFYSFDQVVWVPYISEIHIFTEGITDLYFYAKDLDGFTESIQTLQIKIDTELPIINRYCDGLTGENGWYISAVSVWFEFYDDTSGISEIRVSYDGITWNSYYMGQILTGFPDGITYLFYTGIDTAGLQTQITLIEIKQDRFSPSSSYVIDGILGENSYYLSPVSLTLSTQDFAAGIASFVYSWDGVIWQSYSDPFNFNAEGNYSLLFYAIDFAGNIEHQQSITILIDLAAPTSAFWCDLGVLDSSGLLHIPVEAPCYIEANDTFSGVAHIYYRIDGGEWSEYQGTFNFVTTGEYTLEYYSIDHAGWVESVHTQAIIVEAGIISQQFQGIALFQYNRQLYCGLATLGVNNEVISLMIDTFKISWEVTDHDADGNWESFVAENSYCTIYLLIYHGRYASYAVAVSCPLIFLGYYCG